MKILALSTLLFLPSLVLASTVTDTCSAYDRLEAVQSSQKELGFSDARLTQWYKAKKEKSVTVSVHGLNLKPDKMTDMMKLLNDTGSSVLNVTLQGHGENFESFEQVTKEKWIRNFHNGFCIASTYAKKKNLPLYFFGYSTGATVGLAAKMQNEKYAFKKRILMSPALVMTYMSNMIRLVFPFEFINIPNGQRNNFIAHGATPIPAYKALFQMSDAIRENKKLDLNSTETLVLIDPRDELVSYGGLLKMIEKRNLSRWSVFTVFTTDDKSKTFAPHHSIIAEYFSGPEVWSKISNKTKSFLGSET